MAEARSTKSLLHIGEIDDTELTIILSSFCPRSAQFRPNEVEYRTIDDNLVLTLKYQDEAVMDATAGPELQGELDQQIRSAIETELRPPTGRKVWRTIMFCGRQVEGFWRYGDEFQLVPAPPEAPRPREILADHPFMLDVRFVPSDNWQIQQQRWVRRSLELALVLSLALRGGVLAPSVRPRKHWVLVGDEHRPQWAQEGYWIDGFEHLVADMPSVESLAALPDVPAAEYYVRHYEGPMDMLSVPQELGAIIETSEELAGDERERFLRACYWQNMATIVWDYSQSLYLTSLINSIEALASMGPERSSPEGPSALVKSFMRQYAPGSPSGSLIDSIYDVRSKITHGERLLDSDLAPVGRALDQRSALDRQAGDDAYILSRGAIINWLWSHNRAAQGALVLEGVRREKPAPPGTKSKVNVIIGDQLVDP